MSRLLVAAVVALVFAVPASAHHGFGRFDPTKDVTLEGTLTGIDFVNPHSYLYFDQTTPDGKVLKMRCEMRAATVLRRSGWSAEMFKPGLHVTVSGHPHRDDPASCYIETLTLGDAPAIERYAQLGAASAARKKTDRPARLPSGEPNLAGDWAQEQYLIARPPNGRGGLVPKSMVAGVESGQIPMSEVPDAGWGARRVTFTEAGQKAADAVRAAPVQDNPRMRCEITSILFDWVFDGPINRITQTQDEITLEYGRGLKRTIHMNMTSHPADIVPSRAGHSIGHWDGDTLVVDTVGFSPGMLASPVMNSDKLHVVERFTLDPERMALKREYEAEDPVYYTDKYIGSDTVLPADAPFEVDQCKELTYRNYSQENKEGQGRQ
ncbi:MAG TPA: DUF6152 family protein [Gammaproteobacteria bacterium]|nr:DUF6152 family protein [Gammaproteobacteria bacterium]